VNGDFARLGHLALAVDAVFCEPVSALDLL
jgi:hypothetical protein